jgi:bifunctional DNA-binding transcriptional regulator/antitoxin component of YhaV-PrlF toxin-antitoxin module
MSVGKVGSKGELFPPKKLRIEAGLAEGTDVIFHVIQGRLIVERLHTVEELIKKPSKVVVSIEELKRDRLQLSEDASK